MEFAKQAIIVCAALLLLTSLLPVRRLLLQLPKGDSRRGWHWLSLLMVLMIGSYMTYALGHQAPWLLAEDLIVPSLLLAGSWFIFLASQLSASGIATATRLARLEHECITDGLTGIYNRRHFDQQLEIEQQRSRRHGAPVSLMLIDIDHFKQFNDRYGHQIGDLILIRVCQLIRSLSRSDDIVARYGGEEIAVIAPVAALTAAHKQADRLRRLIAKTQFECGKDQPLSVTVSIGVTQAHALDAGDSKAMVRRADKALYLAKEGGRNRVESLPERRAVARVTDLKAWASTRRSERAA